MEFRELIVKIAKILEDLKIPYAVTGGYAVSVWGRPRSTFDIDIIIELFEPQIPKLIATLRLLSKFGYVDAKQIEDACKRESEFNFIHAESGIKVDFWVKTKDLFAKQELRRRRGKIIDHQKIFFISPEDLILNKLLWYKKSGSDYQLKDVESILMIQRKLDLNYIRKWSKLHSTDKILESLIKRLKTKDRSKERF
jgi:hypothetical protein